jgi:transmembrane sensor
VPELKRPSETRDPVTDEAVAWLLRLRNAPDDPQLKAEFDAWSSLDEKHAEAWRTAQQVWSLAGVVGPASRQPASQRVSASQKWLSGMPPRFKRSKQPARAWGFGLAVAASICVAVILFPSLQLQMRADYVSAIGGTKNVELVDGSRVQLDSGSAIAVDYTPDRRAVRLLAGQAFFTVQRDHQRPFSVEAEDVDVTVTGTEFDVRLASTDVSVAVAAGEVRVTRHAQTDETVLVAGEGLRVRRRDGAAEFVLMAPQSVAPWRRGRLLIESATIGDLVDELRRYRSGTIVITDQALADQRVTGVFDLTDPVRALKTVVEPHAGWVREITPWLVVISRS